jgi:hypothetical protein
MSVKAARTISLAVRELTVQPRSKELVESAREDDTTDFWVRREVVERPV